MYTDDEYIGICDGQISLTVRRHPQKWIARDLKGKLIGQPEKYRVDLFEYLKVTQGAILYRLVKV